MPKRQHSLIGPSTPEICQGFLRFQQMFTGKTLYPYQTSPALAIYEFLLEAYAEEPTILMSRQCLDGNSVIFERDGSACRLKNHPRAWKTGKKSTKRYLIRGGFSLIATDNHPVFTDRGWIPAGDLRTGDRVAVLSSWNKWAGITTIHRKISVSRHKIIKDVEVRLNKRIAKLLGYFCTDGSNSEKQSAKFTNIRMRYLKEFSSLIRREFGIIPKWYKKGNGYDLLLTTTKSSFDNSFRDFLKALNWDHGFPIDIFNAKKSVVVKFINRAWAGDGCVSQKRTWPDVFLACGNSRIYADYWHALLLKIGVASTVKKEWMAKSTKPFYRLVLASGAMNLRRFFSTVGPIFGKEQQSRRAMEWIHACLVRKHGKGCTTKNYRPVYGRGLDGERLAYARIHKIEPSGFREVWDIRYPGKGWFLANGVKVHNSGKTEDIAGIVCTCMVMFPILAKTWPDDLRFNRKDDLGNYRGWKNGYWVGIYAPTKEQADLPYGRIETFFTRTESVAILNSLADPETGAPTYVAGMNLRRVTLSNGSFCYSGSAGKQSKVEGATYHLIIGEEAQDIPDQKVTKSINPMLAATKGTFIKIGTPGTTRGHFYYAIERNKRQQFLGGRKCHFEYDYKECQKHNSFYRDFIQKEKERITENSDEFRMNYKLEWLIERGTFLLPQHLEKVLVTEDSWPNFYVMSKMPKEHKYVYLAKKKGSHVAGIDFGKVHDSTVVTILDVDWSHPVEQKYMQNLETSLTYRSYRKHILGWLELMGDNYEVQFEAIRAFLSLFNIKKIGLDATGVGDPMCDRFVANYPEIVVEGYQISNSWKNDAFKLLMTDIFGVRLTVPSGEETRGRVEYRRFVQQMLDLEKNYVGGYLTCSHPDKDGFHDDYAYSLAIADWCANIPVEEGIEVYKDNFLVSNKKQLFLPRESE